MTARRSRWSPRSATSILFGVAIAALLLGERIGRVRLVACAMIVLGAVSLRAA